MENFSVIFFCFGLGYLFRITGIFPQSYSKAFIDYILMIAFPALIVLTLNTLELREELLYFVGAGLLSLGVAIGLSWGIGRWLEWEEGTIRTVAMMSAFGNTSFVGFPFVRALVGEEGIAYAIVYDQFVSFIPLILFSPLIMGGGIDRHVVKKLFSFPPFLAILMGLLCHGMAFPLFVREPLHLLSQTVIPLILIAVGMNFVWGEIAPHKKGLFAILGIKMVLLPLILLGCLLGLSLPLTTMWEVGVLEMAMPPMVTASLLVAQRGLHAPLASASVGLGIVLAFVFLPIFHILTL